MEPVAVIGFSFKLPQGIESTSSLWDTLEHGKNVMTAWPKDRTTIEGFYSADSSRSNKVRCIRGMMYVHMALAVRLMVFISFIRLGATSLTGNSASLTLHFSP